MALTPDIRDVLKSTTRMLHEKLEKPIFLRRKVAHTPPHPVTHLVAANRRIVLVLANKTVQRFESNRQESETIDIQAAVSSKGGNGGVAKVGGAFLDSTGCHLLLTIARQPGNDSELLYLNRRSTKFRSSPKAKGHLITAVGWCDAPYRIASSNVATTGPLLVGTSKGLVFETELGGGEDKGAAASMFGYNNLEQYWKQVLDVGKNRNLPINGVEFHYVPASKLCSALVATPNRLYQFVGTVSGTEKPMLANVFKVENTDAPGRFIEFPVGSLRTPSTLSLYRKPGTEERSLKKVSSPPKFGWLTDCGIYSGSIVDRGQRGGKRDNGSTVMADCQLVTIPEPKRTTSASATLSGNVSSRALPLSQSPTGMVLTQFHALVAFPTRVMGVSILNNVVVYEDEIDLGSAAIKGIARDHETGSIYTFCDYAIYQYSTEREERNVWKIYLDKREFGAAASFSFGDEEKLKEVTLRQAEDHFENQRYEQSALCYARAESHLETTAIKFSDLENTNPLRTFLMERFNAMKVSDTAQLAIVVLWLFELHLGLIKDKFYQRGKRAKGVEPDSTLEVATSSVNEKAAEQLMALMRQPKILASIKISRSVFYDLLSSHGDRKSLAVVAEILGDYDRVIQQCIQHQEYLPIVEILETKATQTPDLYYEFGPILMSQIPRRFVDSAIAQGKRLVPSKMLATVSAASTENQEMEALRYLEHCVGPLGCRHSSVHNHLLSLYVTHQSHKVLGYINSPACRMLGGGNEDDHHDRTFNSRGDPENDSAMLADVTIGEEEVLDRRPQGEYDASSFCFDVKSALSLCKAAGLRQASVQLHCILGQLPEAVKLALGDPDADAAVESAIGCLKYSSGEEDKRTIWLQIARYVVQDKNDVRTAMEFLRRCDGLVKVEDLLPFFPDFVTIDHFKDAICDSLQDYGRHIGELREEMEEAYAAAEEIRTDIKAFKSRYAFVQAKDRCSLCGDYLMARPFHVFPCSHSFHTNCLMDAVAPYLSAARRKKVRELHLQLLSFATSSSKKGGQGSSSSHEEIESGGGSFKGGFGVKMPLREQVKAELNEIIAAQCVFCGDYMISVIDTPFIPEQEFNVVMAEWL